MVVLSLMCLILSVYVVLVSSPQIIVLTLMWQTLVISLLLSFMNNVWYACNTLFLVFLGGMLVGFIYISSLASSIKVDTQYINFLKIWFIGLFSVFIMISSHSGGLLLSMDHLLYSEYKIIYIFASLSVYHLYIFVVGYLLLTLWVVCVQVKMSSSPMRKLM